MLSLYDRATMAHALTLDLEPRLKALLTARITTLPADLIDYTEYNVIEPGDTEADIIDAIGASPLIEPIDGARYGSPGFTPHWDFLSQHDGWWIMILTYGSTFAYILLIADADGVLPELRRLCREYAA